MLHPRASFRGAARFIVAVSLVAAGGGLNTGLRDQARFGKRLIP
ncbi:hypothetical protein [Pseudomonas sp. B28(2017)]|nr:hypothetical protein [Pseudomonas sp. B28(2017)]